MTTHPTFYTEYTGPHAICHMTEDTLSAELLTERQRSADLLLTLRFVYRALVRVLAERQPAMWHLEQERRERLEGELRDLRAMAVTENFEDAAAVITSYANTPAGTEATLQ